MTLQEKAIKIFNYRKKGVEKTMDPGRSRTGGGTAG
jgi:hypothetical protein